MPIFEVGCTGWSLFAAAACLARPISVVDFQEDDVVLGDA